MMLPGDGSCNMKREAWGHMPSHLQYTLCVGFTCTSRSDVSVMDTHAHYAHTSPHAHMAVTVRRTGLAVPFKSL